MTHAKRQPTKAELAAAKRIDASQRRLEPVQINPITTDLNGCHIIVADAEVSGRPGKTITFIHQSGALAYRANLASPAAHDIATRLTAPPGIEIPPNGTPPA